MNKGYYQRVTNHPSCSRCIHYAEYPHCQACGTCLVRDNFSTVPTNFKTRYWLPDGKNILDNSPLSSEPKLPPYVPKIYIKDVIFSGPATIVFWSDDTKTVVKCSEGDTYDKEKGLAMAIVKKVIGSNSGSYYRKMKEWIKED